MPAIEITKLRRTFNASLGVLNRKIKTVIAVDGISLTRGVASTRTLIAGGNLAEITPLLWQEILIGVVFILIGYLMFRRFEYEAKVRGTLEVF